MGSYVSQHDQINEMISKQYQIQSLPFLTHRKTQTPCTLLKLTARSILQSSKYTQAIEEYGKTKCESIPKLRSSYHIQNTGYCSDQQHFYLVFGGHNNYTVRHQLAKRRHFHSTFTQLQIQQIITALLCGLREYKYRFQRQYQNLSLDRLFLDLNTRRIYLLDPWVDLPQKHSQPYNTRQYSSPQKLKATYDNKLLDIDLFLSNLFSIAVMAFQLNQLAPQDQIYIHKKQINYSQIKSKIIQFKSDKLRKGIECLVDINPDQRKKIYQIWGIQNRQYHYMQSINNKGVTINNENRRLSKTPNSIKKFQFPPVYQQSLKIVKSQAILNQDNLKVNNIVSPNTNLQAHKSFQPFTQVPKTVKFINQQPTVHQQPQLSQRPQYTGHTLINNFQSKNSYFQPILGQRPPKFNQVPHYQPRKNEINLIQHQQHHFPATQQIKIIPYSQQKNIDYSQQYKSSESINLPNSLSSYKESFLYYEPIRPQSKVSDGTIPQLHYSPIKQSIQPYKVQNAIKLQRVQNVLLQPKSKDSSNSLNNQANQRQINHPQTPHKPRRINNFNSTIVQVKDDQDTPDQQIQRAQQMDREYVVEQYQTGSRYQGYKSNQMRNGQGKFYYQDGGYYQGHWRDNKMDGYGKLYYEGGKLAYEGQWAQDQFNGIGRVYNDNPVELDGEFDYTDFNFIDDFWEFYEGSLLHDTKQGRGKIRLSNGQVFEGDFHNDFIQGFGKFYSHTHIIQGIWRQSKLVKIISTAEK